MKNTDIKIGDRVRSFDFDTSRALEGERACYVEGEVIGFTELEGCRRYEIRVGLDVFGGAPGGGRVGYTVRPPVNGTPTWCGVTNFVEKV